MARKKELTAIDKQKMPQHIAIIMDGNGRWANRRLMPRQIGHRAGMEALREIVETVGDLGIPYLTIYAFSTENWKRPQDEISHLMALLLEYLDAELETLHKKGVRIKILGNLAQLDSRVQEGLERACYKTRDNKELFLNIALNYGGRSEIVYALQKIAEKVKKGCLDPGAINEEIIEEHLYTSGMPDPDLLIRTAGEMRISNFLLWQIAYSEIWLTDVMWPDFNREVLLKAITDYQKRDRRFGGTGS